MDPYASNVPYENQGIPVQYTTTIVAPSFPHKDLVQMWLNKIAIISGMLSALFILIIVYCITRMLMIQAMEARHRDHAIHDAEMKRQAAAKNPRWETVEALVQSNSEADWRVAIIEADVLLEEALEHSGFTGSGVGDILANLGKGSFQSYQYAWDAHKVRNDIAHEGSAYKLSKMDAVRVIGKFRTVLEEFNYI